MRVAAQRKTNAYKQTYADNQNISFLPAIMSTSNHMHGEFLRLLFLQAHWETEAHFTAAGMPSQRNQSESFQFKRAAFYQGLKSKVVPVRDGQPSPHSPRLVISRRTCPPISLYPPPPRKQFCTRSCSNKHTHPVTICRGNRVLFADPDLVLLQCRGY
jgi:hypothetical protein